LAQLDASISSLESRIRRIQAKLDIRMRQLATTRRELHAARIRLKQLEAFQARAERTLSAALVRTYEGDNPDLVTVVLESNGFQNLLERVSFAARIRKQDVQIIHEVRAARRAVAAEAVRLGALEVRQQDLTNQVRQQRDELTSAKISLVHQQIAMARDRASKSGQLASARGRVADLQRQLSNLVAAQAAAAARAAAASAASSAPAAAPGASGGAAPVGPGGFAFPLPKGSASPPGTWSPDQGVDISAPGDTPEYAVCSGTIVLHGIGGFGPWAPVLHCDSGVGGYSYVYYGHAGPANQLPVGTHVSAGEVMSSVGPGIVGISTGPHLEIGFCDSSGSPIGAGSAGTMMSLLQSTY
jgi:murein DD-endopeptidase MepM/ murein hydrolase activator NlpD